MRTLTFAEDTSLSRNPDRGLGIMMENGGTSRRTCPLEDYLNYVARFEDSGASTILPRHHIGPWRDGPLPHSLLDRIQGDFDTAREEGFRLVPRFHYATDFNLPLRGHRRRGGRDARADRGARGAGRADPRGQRRRAVVRGVRPDRPLRRAVELHRRQRRSVLRDRLGPGRGQREHRRHPGRDHDVLLHLPDPAERIADDPRYAIRLANEGVWEAETGLNDLGARVRLEASAPDVIGASGAVTLAQLGPDAWTRVEFGVALEDAVVVMGPPTANGAQPTSVRVRDVDATGFEVQLDQWGHLDGRHVAETLGWMALEAGTHRLADGRVIAAGWAEAGGGRWTTVDLGAGFEAAPAVLAGVRSPDGSGALAPRLRDVEAAGFRFRLDAEEAAGGTASEGAGVGWIAAEAGLRVLEAGRIDHRGALVDLGEGLGAPPLVLAAMQTTRGGDPAALRLDALGPAHARLRVEQERSADAEVWHAEEDVAVLAADAGLIEGWDWAS